MNEAEFLCWIIMTCKEHGNQNKAAAKFGISKQYLSDILHGRRDISPAVAARLGCTSVTKYYVPQGIKLPC